MSERERVIFTEEEWAERQSAGPTDADLPETPYVEPPNDVPARVLEDTFSPYVTAEAIQRAFAPGGALFHITQELQAEDEARATAAEQAAARKREDAAIALKQTADALLPVRERRWAALVELADATEEWQPLWTAYRYAKSRAFQAGAEVTDPIFDFVTAAQGDDSYARRQEIRRIRQALNLGVT